MSYQALSYSKSPSALDQPVVSPSPPSTPTRKRPKPGERRLQILQMLASMLEQPGIERVTTASLAGRLGVSEAALYRHFASKAQMFEGLIDFIEESVLTLVHQIEDREPEPVLRARQMISTTIQFAEKNPGMVRVMVGDALVFENDRLQKRMALFFDKLEATLRQNLRLAAHAAGHAAPTVVANAQASIGSSYLVGALQRFARSGFRRPPTEQIDVILELMLPHQPSSAKSVGQ